MAMELPQIVYPRRQAPGGHVLVFVRPRLDRTFPLALAVLAACGAGSQAPAGQLPAAPPAAPPVVAPVAPPVAPVTDAHAGAPDTPAEPAVSLSEADCRAFEAASALGVAVVASVDPDCSGVGHSRIVLEVRRLARGERIATIVTSRPLVGPARGELAVGDTLVVAIDPEVRAAETVFCVALPASEGALRHAFEVDSLAAAGRVLDELAAGRACPPSR
jgi:hypothetical protein